MRTLTLLISVATLVAACGPTATPEPTSVPPTAIPPTAPPSPVEAPVAEMADLAGRWWFTQCPCKIQFNSDGTYVILGMSTGEKEAEGRFTLDSGKVTWVTSDPLCKELPAATYEAYVTKQDGRLFRLRLVLVGTDVCAMRVDALKGAAKFLKP